MSPDTDTENPRRVLIVEDVPRLREMLHRAVREMEFLPNAVDTGEAGLAALEVQPVDIILADLNLPGMHGLEFCQEVRRRWPTIQIIILTGYGDLESAKQAMHLDVVDFLTKPCELHELESALDRALRRRHDPIFQQKKMKIQTLSELEANEDEPQNVQTIDEIERDHILDTLARYEGNRAKAAKEMGISLRKLYYRLNQYEKQGYFTREQAED